MTPRIAVLLATYNGAEHLRTQLDSLALQRLRPWWLIVSDDGSTDGTIALLQDFARDCTDISVQILEGPRKGGAMNFLHLMRHIPQDADAIALCDQDDVWLPEKLERGWAALDGTATLYAAATWVCDARLEGKRMSRRPTCTPSFRHALVQNIAGGNTMMINRAGFDLIRQAIGGIEKLTVHDWWLYQVMTGAGARIVFDPEPVLLYRQHGRNEIGANDGIGAKIRRMGMLLSGTFRDWNAINLAALSHAEPVLTPEARETLDMFERLRCARLGKRLRLLHRAGLYRQDTTGNLSLWVAAVLGRI